MPHHGSHGCIVLSDPWVNKDEGNHCYSEWTHSGNAVDCIQTTKTPSNLSRHTVSLLVHHWPLLSVVRIANPANQI